MKKLVFELPLNKVQFLEEYSFSSIENFVESFSKGFLNISVKLLSDINEKEDLIQSPENGLAFENIKHLTNFIIYYLYNILLNNDAAIQRKKNPYDVNIIQKISFSEKQFQLYLFLDDSIFGLCVGTQFRNVLNLIKGLFPLIAKTDFLNEVRFFPISREEYILKESGK